jgi:hypothetical protein
MAIVCILATGAVYMYSNPTAKVKGVAFAILTDLNWARSEAVNRNQDILVDFTLGGRDGYLICLDRDSDRDCNDEAAEDIIKAVLFRGEVQFYDCVSAPPYPDGGPTKTPAGTKLAGKNGLIFGGPNYIKWQPDGTSSDNGSIIVYHPASNNPQKVKGDPYAAVISSASTGVYHPASNNPQKVKGDPYAAVISSASTGKIRLMRWRRESGWSKK